MWVIMDSIVLILCYRLLYHDEHHIKDCESIVISHMAPMIVEKDKRYFCDQLKRNINSLGSF